MEQAINTSNLEQQASDESLLAAVKARDQVAFGRLYRRHCGRVHALCLRLCGDRSMAEDAVQEVFVQVWRKADSFAGGSAFATWLHSVACNTTLSYLRRQKGWLGVMRSRAAEAEEELQPAGGAMDLSRLDRLVMRLPERARLVFVLHAIEGLRHEDIARKLKTTTGTSKAHFHRARTLLKTWLDDE